jgi:uncharacterized protein YjcR
MSKNLNLRLIKQRESYLLKQISELLNVHMRTVQAWKQEGLPTINDEKPFLVMGYDLKEFLSKKIKNRKTKLQANQFYCTKCRKAARSTNNEVWIEVSEKTIGKQGFKSFVIKGICEVCNSKLNRFSHEGKLEEIKNIYDVVNLEELGYE